MAIVRSFIYTSSGTEIEFMQGLIDIMCEVLGVTCTNSEGNPTTAAEQFADLTSASTATFYMRFSNGQYYYMQRSATNNAQASSYWFGSYSGGRFGAYIGGSGYPSTATARSLSVAYIKSDNMKCFWWDEPGRTWYTDKRAFVGAIINGEDMFTVVSANQGNSPMAHTYTGDIYNINFVTCLPYTCGAGKIDIAESIPAISGGVKAFNFDTLKQCSTVAQYSSIAVPDGRNFFAIHTNILIELDADEEE